MIKKASKIDFLLAFFVWLQCLISNATAQLANTGESNLRSFCERFCQKLFNLTIILKSYSTQSTTYRFWLVKLSLEEVPYPAMPLIEKLRIDTV